MLGNILSNLPEFLCDALVDSLKLIPFLVVIFVFIEIFENFFAHKIINIVSFSRKIGPIIGAALATIPQCGFSVIMTTLFIKRYVTLGTLISVYIATSDEAIPILLANPDKFHTVIKIILIKFSLAVLSGYLIDFFIKSKLHKCKENQNPCSHLKNFKPEKGCCSHKLNENRIKNIIIHPIKHTFFVFVFIFVVCALLNYIFNNIDNSIFEHAFLQNKILQTAFFAVFGLIPNCAVSVLITMLYLKGVIYFGSIIAGLTTNAGLGLLILFTRKNSWKRFSQIVGILVLIGFLAGLVL